MSSLFQRVLVNTLSAIIAETINKKIQKTISNQKSSKLVYIKQDDERKK